ncbi:hypothetical protein Ciccas_003802 [Cichlidogyrus casuarinus]|uniref:Uncharacterized protein n=1 Tax=Cichlidogyrus casuarinus TaxID=1844966 RepID=A0ABD2QE84_9PLAT
MKTALTFLQLQLAFSLDWFFWIPYTHIRLPYSAGTPERKPSSYGQDGEPIYELNNITLLLFGQWSSWTICPFEKDSNTDPLKYCIPLDKLEQFKQTEKNKKTRYRICREKTLENFSDDSHVPCSEENSREIQKENCPPPMPCPPPNGGWTQWSYWSPCTVDCKGESYDRGRELRMRTCTNPTPIYGGQICKGPKMERRDCTDNHRPPCPIDGSWSPWQPTRSCEPLSRRKEDNRDLPKGFEWDQKMMDVTTPGNRCAPGTMVQERHCIAPNPRYGGKMCSLSDADSVSLITSVCRFTARDLKPTI